MQALLGFARSLLPSSNVLWALAIAHALGPAAMALQSDSGSLLITLIDNLQTVSCSTHMLDVADYCKLAFEMLEITCDGHPMQSRLPLHGCRSGRGTLPIWPTACGVQPPRRISRLC